MSNTNTESLEALIARSAIYEAAARAVHSELLKETGRRKHAQNYKKHAAKALGMRSVYPSRWERVLAEGFRLGLFRIDRETLRHPFLVLLLTPATAPAEDASTEDTGDRPAVDASTEDTGDRPAVDACATETHAPTTRPTTRPPTRPPVGFRCVSCNKSPGLHWFISLPEDNTDYYLDSDSTWKCHSCARVHFSESWGGVKRWLAEHPEDAPLYTKR